MIMSAMSDYLPLIYKTPMTAMMANSTDEEVINGLMFDVSSNLIFDLINCTIKPILNGQIKYVLLHRWFENFQNLHFNNRVL